MSQQGKPQPLKPGGGFSKRNAGQLTVMVDEVAKMQQGYEDRIARQKASLDRLSALLSERTDQLTRQMQGENDRVQEWGLPAIEEVRLVNRPALKGPDDDQTWVAFVIGLIPEDFDMFNEDDTKESIIASYIRYLQRELDEQRSKQISQGQALKGSEQARLACEQKLVAKQAELDQANRNLAQAVTDARHNAKQANTAFQQVQMDDDTPPWEKPGYVPPASSIGNSLVERHTPVNEPVHPAAAGDSETVQFSAFDGPYPHPGETKPGKF